MPDTRHYPANPDKFEFDAEVAAIFPNMAERSIPNYHAFHRMHAEIVARWFAPRMPLCRMLDIGASHGAFYQALDKFYADTKFARPAMQQIAIDNSEDMCSRMRDTLPGVLVRCESIDEPKFLEYMDHSFDVINCTYVVQFVRPERQRALLTKMARMVRPGGILILGQKDEVEGIAGSMMHEQYIEWRVSNGYSRAEIEAKTRALQGSMWPMRHSDLRETLAPHFREITETSRLFQFNTLICIK